MKMRIPGMFVAVAAALMVSTAVHAAEDLHLNASDKRWGADLLAFLQQKKPTADGVSIAITPAGDVHAYVVPGAFTGVYSIERLHRHPTDHPSAAVRAIIDGGTGRMIGFVSTDKTEKAEGEQRGARFDVY